MYRILFFLFVLLLAGCLNSPPPTPHSPGIVKRMEAGVLFRGVTRDEMFSNGTASLTNNNPYVVTVQACQQSHSHGRGEETVWVKKIKPDETIEFESKYAMVFYIYDNGDLSGFIQPWHGSNAE